MEDQFKKNDVRAQYRDLKRSSQFHHAVDGNIVEYKARFVARGFSQKEGLDYEETFAASKSLNTYMMSLMNILTFATSDIHLNGTSPSEC